MLTRVTYAIAISITLGMSSWSPASLARGTWAKPVCAAAAPVSGTPGVPLVLAVPAQPRDLNTRDGAVQLCLITAAGAVSPLYRPLPTSDIAMSANRRELAYSDSAYRVHLVRLPGGTDRVISRGTLPGFSFDGRYLAFVTSDTLPLPTSSERLMVYDRATGSLTRAGPTVLPRAEFSSPATLYAWAPRADTLAWVPSPDRSSVAVVPVDRPAARRAVTVPGGEIGSELVWSMDGRGLLYWHFVSSGPSANSQAPRYSLLRWRLPNGPAETVVAAASTLWIEGVVPAPASDATGTLFASLLGAPHGGLNQVVLYAHGQRPRSIRLPGEPRLVRFAPKGTQFIAIWSPPYGRGIASHAALVDTTTGRVEDLGPAVGAFWTE
jgi:hypothetical protein